MTDEKTLLETNPKIARTYLLLRQYLRFAVPSRSFMLEFQSEMLAAINARAGRFASYPEDQLQFTRCSIYADLLQRVCLLTEDFARLCFALREDLENFEDRIARQDIKAGDILAELNDEHWRILLRHIDGSSVGGLTEEQQKLLSDVQGRNVKNLNRFTQSIIKFRSLYLDAHNRIKHSNSLVFGFAEFEHEGCRLTLLPYIVKDLPVGEMKGLLVDENVLTEWRRLFNALTLTIEDFLGRAIEVIERNGALLAERRLYIELGKEKYARLKEVSDLIDKPVIQLKPKSASMTSELSEDLLKEFSKKYLEPQQALSKLLTEMGY